MPKTTQHIVFSFEDLSSKSTAVKKIQKELARLGTPAQVEIADQTKRKAGITYKELTLVFEASSQIVTLGIKKTGDIFEVKLNKKPLPIKNQDDQKAAIKEISDAVLKNAPKWQKVLERRKITPAETKIVTPRKKQAQVLTDRKAELLKALEEAKKLRDSLKATNDQLKAQEETLMGGELPLAA